jgi:hypothetical protein
LEFDVTVAGIATQPAANVSRSFDHRLAHLHFHESGAGKYSLLKIGASRLHSCPVKLKNILFTVAFFPVAHFAPSQTQPSVTSTLTAAKLDVETIVGVPMEERRRLLSALTPAEREKFFERFVQLPPGGPSNGKINALFMAWAAIDARVAFDDAKKLPTADARRAAIEALCYGMSSEAAGDIAKALKDLPADTLVPEQKERLLSLSIIKWSQRQPAEAAQFLAQVYPDASQRLAKPSAGDGDLMTATRGVAANWGASAPEAAIESFKDKNQPENLLGVQSAIEGWWGKDPKAAAAYVAAHSTTPNERQVAAAMAGPMAEQDPKTAANWVEWMKDDKMRRRARLGIAQLWASRAPAEAGKWAQSLSGNETNEVIIVVAGTWTAKDAKAAEQWINKLPASKRDAAIRGYSAAMMRMNPEQALSWATKVQDAKMRISLAKAISSEWMRRSPGEAEQWIKKSKLTKSEKTELLKGSQFGE